MFSYFRFPLRRRADLRNVFDPGRLVSSSSVPRLTYEDPTEFGTQLNVAHGEIATLRE